MTIKTRFTGRFKQIFENVAPRRDTSCYLVYYDGGPASVAALREACEMAKPGTRVMAVFLDLVPLEEEIPDNAPVHEMLSQAILAAAIVNGRFYGVEVQTLGVPCHSRGPAFVALAAGKSNTTCFIGVQETPAESGLDTFAKYVISLAPCKVVLVGQETDEDRMILE